MVNWPPAGNVSKSEPSIRRTAGLFDMAFNRISYDLRQSLDEDRKPAREIADGDVVGIALLEIFARVHDRKLVGVSLFKKSAQSGILLDGRRRGVEQEILGVAPIDGRVCPDPAPKAIDHSITALLEERRPVLGPLLVDVVETALVRNRGGE